MYNNYYTTMIVYHCQQCSVHCSNMLPGDQSHYTSSNIKLPDHIKGTGNKLLGYVSINTVYREIFTLLNLRKFHKFSSVAKLSPCHTFYIADMDHLREYFSRIFISQNYSDAKISQYTVIYRKALYWRHFIPIFP